MASHGSTTASTRRQGDVITRVDDDEHPPSRAKITRGTELSRYLILYAVGEGGMGRVFSAHDPELDRRVAIKVLYDSSEASSSSGANELLKEGRALASLRHPNIVSVYDVGWYEGELFIAMEYVDGRTLDLWQKRNDDTDSLLTRYLEAGAALAAAHDAGIVHGDFKPTNVMVEQSGRTVVLDFGLARTMVDPERLKESDHRGTTRGVGTPAYMAPEQHTHQRPTQWSDQFSFCVALYEAFVGKRPFPNESLLKLTRAVLEGDWSPPGAKMPTWIWRVVERGLQVNPRDRFPDMHSLLRALDPQRRRRRLLGLGGGGVALAATVGVGMALADPRPCDDADAMLDGVWDPEVRAMLEDQYADTKAWPRVRDRLDDFGTRWTEAWRETCEATHVHATQSEALLDRRMACLQADRIAVEAAVRQLEHGEYAMIRRATSLPVFDRNGSRCRTEALGRRKPPPPKGPQRDRYEDLLRTAADLYAMSAIAGDPRVALARLDTLERPADTHPDVVQALEHARAEAHLQLDHPKDAQQAWMRAARAADAAGDDAAFVRVASTLAYLEVQELDRLDAAEIWIDRARSRGQGVDLTHGERFTLELRAAVVARYRGEAEEAAATLERLLETEGPYINADQEGTLHHNLGELRNQLREREEAVAEFRRAIELRSKAFGPNHRQVGQSRFMLSRAFIEQGELDLAEQELEEAARVFANVEGGAPERVMAEESRAILSAMRGDVALASTQMRAVIELANETLAPEDRRIATLLVNHGRMLMMLGKLDEAVAQVQRGIDLETQVAGPEHHDLAESYGLLAEIELARGHANEAERLASRAAELAAAPDTQLELKLAALMSRAHAACSVDAAKAEALALLEASKGTSDMVEKRRESIDAWAMSVAAYPSCAR